MRELQSRPALRAVADGEEIMPGMTAHVAPGHTPGHLVFFLQGRDRDAVFTGDAAKNRAEMLSRRGEATYDAATSSASIGMIWDFWRRREGSILVPGHDVPMTQNAGRPHYLGKREAAIMAWLGDDIETTTLFQLKLASG
jgi:N-acyl homoserine lactone hydrolase